MTLSEFSAQIRVVGKLAVFAFLILVFFYLVITLLLTSFKKTEVVDLNLKPVYGTISPPVFEEPFTMSKLKFELNTIDGKYPETTPSAHVFFIPEPKSTLAYLTKVELLAKTFAFDTFATQPQTLNEEWVKYEDATKILEVNIRSYHFKFRYKAGEELQSLIEATPEAKFTLLENTFIEEARSTLSSRNSYPPELAAGSINPLYVRYDLSRNQFVPVAEGEYPQAMRIDFFRQQDTLPIESPFHFTSQNYVILAPLNKVPQVVEAGFMSYETLRSDPGVYPLLTSEEAFLKLKKGEATTINLKEPVSGKIKIKEIYVSYYDPLSYQAYFQPIFVFLGDHNYVGYLPAIRDEYLAK